MRVQTAVRKKDRCREEVGGEDKGRKCFRNKGCIKRKDKTEHCMGTRKEERKEGYSTISKKKAVTLL